MLKIRLARGGRKKKPFYRIVLTEHTKPVQTGYITVLGWFDPALHKTEMDIDAIKEWISKGAQPSNRVAKLAKKQSGDDFFDAYITFIERTRKPKNAPEEDENPAETPAKEEAPAETTNDAPAAESEAPAETPSEETKEDPKDEAPAEEAPAEEDKKEE